MKKRYETIGVSHIMTRSFTNLKEAQKYARYLSRSGDTSRVLVFEDGKFSTHSLYKNKRIVK